MNNIYCTIYVKWLQDRGTASNSAASLGSPAVAMIALKCNENIEMKLSREIWSRPGQRLIVKACGSRPMNKSGQLPRRMHTERITYTGKKESWVSNQ